MSGSIEVIEKQVARRPDRATRPLRARTPTGGLSLDRARAWWRCAQRGLVSVLVDPTAAGTTVSSSAPLALTTVRARRCVAERAAAAAGGSVAADGDGKERAGTTRTGGIPIAFPPEAAGCFLSRL